MAHSAPTEFETRIFRCETELESFVTEKLPSLRNSRLQPHRLLVVIDKAIDCATSILDEKNSQSREQEERKPRDLSLEREVSIEASIQLIEQNVEDLRRVRVEIIESCCINTGDSVQIVRCSAVPAEIKEEETSPFDDDTVAPEDGSEQQSEDDADAKASKGGLKRKRPVSEETEEASTSTSSTSTTSGKTARSKHGSRTTVIDFVALSSSLPDETITTDFTGLTGKKTRHKHPAENLYWINIADVDGIAPPRDRNGEGGRYWPCLFYEGGYDEAMKDVDRSQKGFLSNLQKEKLKERNRNLILANAAPPSSRPIFIPLGITPHRAIPLHDGIRTKSQAESQGLILDYWEGYDNVKALRGFPNAQVLDAAQRANIDIPIPNTDPPISKFDRAFQFASDIIDHRAELHDDTSSEDYAHVYENSLTSNNGRKMALLPPSTAPDPSASVVPTAARPGRLRIALLPCRPLSAAALPMPVLIIV